MDAAFYVPIKDFHFCSRAEQEVLLRRCSVYSDDKMKIRHSFFRRSKKSSHGYTISHSRESSDSRGDEAGSSIGSCSAAFTNGTFLVLSLSAVFLLNYTLFVQESHSFSKLL